MNSVISSHKVKRTKNICSLVLYSLYLLSVLSSLKCTVVSKEIASLSSLPLQRPPCCHKDFSADVRRRVLQVQFALKKNIIFLISLICTCLWRPDVLLCVVHPGGRPSSGELIPGQLDRGSGKDSNMPGEFYQRQLQWLSSQDVKLGLTLVTAANEKPCLLLTALCRGCPCCLPTQSSPQGAHADSTEGRLCVPSLNVEGPVSRCHHRAELVGSLSGCVSEYQKIDRELGHHHSSEACRESVLAH